MPDVELEPLDSQPDPKVDAVYEFGQPIEPLLDQVDGITLGERWRAHDTESGQTVVVTVLDADHTTDDDYVEYFYREALAAANLHNAHLIPILEVDEIDHRHYVATPFVDGRSLRDILDEGPLAPSHAVSVVAQIASALGVAHRAGLVHGDVTPSKVLIGHNNSAYLTDLGIAPDLDADVADDVYGLASVLSECLGGYSGEADHGLAEVVAKGTAADPRMRYSSVKQLAQAAKAALPQTDDVDAPGNVSAQQVTPVARPATVILASVLAFFQVVFFWFLFALQLWTVRAISSGWIVVSGLSATVTSTAFTVVLGVATAAISVLLIWGGVSALRGRSGRLLQYVEQAAALVAMVHAVMSPTYMTVLVVCAAVVIVLLAVHPSRAYFDANRMESDSRLDGQSITALITVVLLLVVGWLLFSVG